MQRYSTHGTLFKEGGGWLVAEKRDVYLASDVDARIAELEKALQEILGHVLGKPGPSARSSDGRDVAVPHI